MDSPMEMISRRNTPKLDERSQKSKIGLLKEIIRTSHLYDRCLKENKKTLIELTKE